MTRFEESSAVREAASGEEVALEAQVEISKEVPVQTAPSEVPESTVVQPMLFPATEQS